MLARQDLPGFYKLITIERDRLREERDAAVGMLRAISQAQVSGLCGVDAFGVACILPAGHGMKHRGLLPSDVLIDWDDNEEAEGQ